MRQLKDFYNEMRRCLAKAPLFVLYLDGFGYYMYEYARKKGVIPCMEEHFLIEPVCSVKPPVTNPAMATILTGRLPKQHLITDRRGHVPAVPTIFGEWKEQAVCLEGDSVIIRTEILPRLHTARQGKSADEWIFQSALREIEKDTRFIFAHFHGIDDAAHRFGPYGTPSLDEIRRKDEMTGEICSRFKGQILLISDHGLYEKEQTGDHGFGYREDLTAVWGKRR